MVCLGFTGRDVSDGLEQAAVLEVVHRIKCGGFCSIKATLRVSAVDGHDTGTAQLVVTHMVAGAR